jgi:hypothetical protein
LDKEEKKVMKISTWIIFFCSFIILSAWSGEKLQKGFTGFTGNVAAVLGQGNVFQNRTPICLDRSNIPEEEYHWLYIPTASSELATNEYYGFLSGQLIQTGAVDASDCPLNGLGVNGYANACGLEKAREKSAQLQNVYDDEILLMGKGIGVPPVMIKQLIRQESQFWPAQSGLYHYGLGHLTYLGASNALTWSRDLFEATYAHSLPDTSADLPSELLFMMNAYCPTCVAKINIPKAEQSITYISEALMGYCRQTSQIVYNATKKNAGDVVDYATIWKLTLVNYNMGPLCVYDAVRTNYKIDDKDKLTWDVIADNLRDDKTCSNGLRYVENITGKYYDFGDNP